jgi:hypothetical protein
MKQSDPYVTLRNQLTELMRMSTGDPLSLRAWYEEAQRLMRFARDQKLELPALVPAWLAAAEARAKDPLLAATQNAELAKFLATLPRS